MMEQSVARETRVARGATGAHNPGSGGATPPPATSSPDSYPIPQPPAPARRLALYLTGKPATVTAALEALAKRDAWRGGAA